MGNKGLLLHVAGSPVRVSLLQLLAERPRALTELSQELKITPQAVLKHLRALVKFGFVSTIRVERAAGTALKQLYRLEIPIDIEVEEGDGFVCAHLFACFHAGGARGHAGPSRSLQALLKALEEAEDEGYFLQRRLRPLRERERRLFRELAALEMEKARLIREGACTPLEELFISAYLKGAGFEPLYTLGRNLRVREAWVTSFLQRLGVKTGGSGPPKSPSPMQE